MTEPRSPLDQALDLLVFAPLGLAVMAQEHIPGLIEKGRQRWATQATMARMVGEFAVNKGRQDATKAARRASDVLEGFGLHLGDRPADAPGDPGGTAGTAGTASGSAGSAGTTGSAGSAGTAGTASGSAGSAGPTSGSTRSAASASVRDGSPPAPPSTAPAGASSAGHLAIPGYDSLSAPQVVSRLDGLSSEELEAVRVYEQSTRGRKTILGRVAQLQALLD